MVIVIETNFTEIWGRGVNGKEGRELVIRVPGP